MTLLALPISPLPFVITVLSLMQVYNLFVIRFDLKSWLRLRALCTLLRDVDDSDFAESFLLVWEELSNRATT